MKRKEVPERIQEIRRLYEQLDGLGLHDGFDEIVAFKKIANDYVKHGTPASGSIHLPQAKRKLVYVLTTRKDRPCTIILKAD